MPNVKATLAVAGTAAPPSSAPAPARALPEPETLTDLVQRLAEIGSHWHAVISDTLEINGFAPRAVPEPLQPMPAWAVERLKDQGRLRQAHTDFYSLSEQVLDLVKLLEDGVPRRIFVVQDERGVRLDRGHEDLASATEAADRIMRSGQAKGVARVLRIHRRSPARTFHDPALLGTFVGRIFWSATYFGRKDAPDRFELQDDTGRTVAVSIDEIRACPGLWERLDGELRERLKCEEKAQQERCAS